MYFNIIQFVREKNIIILNILKCFCYSILSFPSHHLPRVFVCGRFDCANVCTIKLSNKPFAHLVQKPRHKPAFSHQVGEFCKALLELSCAFSQKQSDEWHQQRWLHQNNYFWMEGFDYHRSQHCGPWLLQSLQIPSNCQIQQQKILGQDLSTCLFHTLKGTIISCYK